MVSENGTASVTIRVVDSWRKNRNSTNSENSAPTSPASSRSFSEEVMPSAWFSIEKIEIPFICGRCEMRLISSITLPATSTMFAPEARLISRLMA